MLDPNTEAIVAMAWARSFGLPDNGFAGESRTLKVNGGGVISVIRLFGRTLLAGPAWALEQAADYPDDVLLSVPGLLDLAKEHRPSASSADALLYADDYVQFAGLTDAEVTGEQRALRDLLPLCAPDEVSAASLADHQQLFVLLDDAGEPTAAAAYTAQHGILADLAVLCSIDARGTGAAEAAGAIAMHDALDAGLIPQLRLGVDDDQSLARALSFEQLGTIARVAVDG